MLDSATLQIKDQMYTLRFPLGAMVKAEKALSRPLQVVFTPTEGKIPDYKIEELIILFRIGLKAEHPEITNEKSDDLLSDFLSEGSSILQQTLMVYLLIGKAMGFFRVEMDFQKLMSQTTLPDSTLQSPLKK